MARKFEKISFKQFKKDVRDDIDIYESYNIPKRKTMHSAGYDFEALENYIIKPNQFLKIPTGIKVMCGEFEFVMLLVRSSMGFTYNTRIVNQVGIVDCDYYNNEGNEGHIWIKIQNEGNQDLIIKKGECFVQGIFSAYLIADEEEKIDKKRTGGLGSTSKGDE